MGIAKLAHVYPLSFAFFEMGVMMGTGKLRLGTGSIIKIISHLRLLKNP
jgi:hypothetical protein